MKIKLLYIILLLTTQATTPRAGDLDPTFGDGTGKVTTPVSTNNDVINAALLQPDGKIIGLGSSDTNNILTVARYNSNGSLDTSFGTAGIANNPATSVATYNAGLLQPDNKIIGIGTFLFFGTQNFLVTRYNTNGTLDTSFGFDGISFILSDAQANAGLLQPDNKIIAIGFINNGSNDDFALARFNTDGTLDTSFGSTSTTPGTIITPVSANNDQAYAGLLQPDGKIIAIGFSNNGSNNDFALVRYNTDGSLDTSFGTNGIVTTPIGSNDAANAALLQPDGKIIAIGSTNSGVIAINNFALVRYNPDGSLDFSFGTDGKVITDFAGKLDAAFAALLQPDGKIIALGRAREINDNFALARYNPDGSRDSSFGADGKVTTDFFGGSDQAFAALLQPDGKIIALGSANNGTNGNDFALARYLTDALTITKTASAPIACPGQNITYTICANNFGGGGGTVNGIEITDILPDNIIFRSAAANMGTFDPITGTWSIDYLQVNNKATLKIKARVDQCAGNTLIKNTALTSYSSVDMVSDSSIIDVQNQDFSTTECISTLPVINENVNIIAQRTDCGVDNITDELCTLNTNVNLLDHYYLTTNAELQTVIYKLDCLSTFLSATDCTF